MLVEKCGHLRIHQFSFHIASCNKFGILGLFGQVLLCFHLNSASFGQNHKLIKIMKIHDSFILSNSTTRQLDSIYMHVYLPQM